MKNFHKIAATLVLTMLLAACSPTANTPQDESESAEENTNSSQESDSMTAQDEDQITDDEDADQDQDSMLETEVELRTESEVNAATSEMAEEEVQYQEAQYITDSNAIDQPGPKVVYFHATWCPTCKALTERVTSNLDQYPNGTKIVQVDYDTENELKQKYDIKVQTSLVVLDADNNVVEKLVNPSDDQLIAAINKSL